MTLHRGRLYKAQQRLAGGLGQTLSAIKVLDLLEPLDRERLQHQRDLIERTCARIFLDIAEAVQGRELAEASRLDAELLACERRKGAEDLQIGP